MLCCVVHRMASWLCCYLFTMRDWLSQVGVPPLIALHECCTASVWWRTLVPVTPRVRSLQSAATKVSRCLASPCADLFRSKLVKGCSAKGQWARSLSRSASSLAILPAPPHWLPTRSACLLRQAISWSPRTGTGSCAIADMPVRTSAQRVARHMTLL